MKEGKENRVFTLNESRADLVLGIFFLVFSLLLLLVIIPTQIADVGKAFPYPRSFPRFCGYSMLLLSAVLLYQSHKKKGKAGGETVTFSARGIKMTLAALGILAGSVLLLKFLPYIPVTAALLIAMMLLLGQRNKIVLVSVGVVMPTLVYFFFTQMLKLVLP